MASLPEILKIARSVTRSSPQDVADQIGVSRATISRLEKGHDPDMDTARKLSNWLGVCACCGQPTSQENDEPEAEPETKSLPKPNPDGEADEVTPDPETEAQIDEPRREENEALV